MKKYTLIDKSVIQNLINEKKSLQKICEEIFGFCNGTTKRKLHYSLEEYGINHKDITKAYYETRRKHQRVEVKCPVCGKLFENKLSNRKDQKTVCSKACSNTFFKSGTNNPNWKDETDKKYRWICFENHEKKCVVCGENKIVEVHHYDENHNNNNPENLVPLCPTHHQYWHSKYKDEVKPIVDEYVTRWKDENPVTLICEMEK